MDLESKPTILGPEPQVLVASRMLTPSYQDYLLGRALPVREHTTELLNVLFDDGLAGGGMSSQEIEAVLATVAGRLH
jgi:hypothetical protein